MCSPHERTRHGRVNKIISAGKDPCLRSTCSPVSYINPLHRQMHVKICKETTKTGWKLVHPKHLCIHQKAFIHARGKAVGLFLIPKQLTILLLHESVHLVRVQPG